jgi:hypothetical protein
MVIWLQGKRDKIYCFILIICLIASCLCFDELKTDGSMYLFDATNESSQVITAGYSFSNEDACTLEMLGNIHTSLLSHQATPRNSETQRKSESLYFLLDELAFLHSPFKFFTSANLNIYIADTDVAEIIHFIHEKDGKKRI